VLLLLYNTFVWLIYFCSAVVDFRISSKQIPRLMAADVLFVLTLQSTKEWLLDFDVGVFWVVMRVLACGGLGVLVWEVMTQQVAKRKDIEVGRCPLFFLGLDVDG
jgi:zinc transporter 5/7